MPGVDMFREHNAVVADAYARRGNEIAYREEAADEPPNHTSVQSTFRAAE
jgi:hypothetical protein